MQVNREQLPHIRGQGRQLRVPGCNSQPRQHIQKQRHYFANKGLSSQGYGFSSSHVWMWELDCEESWALKNWCFWTVIWRRLLRVPWTARRSNQSILKEISPGCSLEEMMLKLKLQYFGHLMQRVDSLEKTLMLGGIWGQEEEGKTEDEMAGWHHWLDGHEFEWTPGDGDGQGAWHAAIHGVAKSQTWLSDWTELNWKWEKYDLVLLVGPYYHYVHVSISYCFESFFFFWFHILRLSPQNNLESHHPTQRPWNWLD